MGEGDASNNTEENFEFNEQDQANEFLRLIRNEMTVEGIEKNTRAKSTTFDTHQNENTRFIEWLFYNHGRFIHDELSHDLQEVVATVDYDANTSRSQLVSLRMLSTTNTMPNLRKW